MEIPPPSSLRLQESPFASAWTSPISARLPPQSWWTKSPRRCPADLGGGAALHWGNWSHHNRELEMLMVPMWKGHLLGEVCIFKMCVVLRQKIFRWFAWLVLKVFFESPFLVCGQNCLASLFYGIAFTLETLGQKAGTGPVAFFSRGQVCRCQPKKGLC